MPGASHEPSRAPANLRPDSGMSLMEMLVALAILAMAAGAVTGSLAPAGDRRAETEARRLAARLELAIDTALVDGEPVLLDWDERHYRIGPAPAEGSEVNRADRPGVEHRLPDQVRMQGPTARGVLVVDWDGLDQAAEFRFRDGSTIWRVVADGFSTAVESIEPGGAA